MLWVFNDNEVLKILANGDLMSNYIVVGSGHRSHLLSSLNNEVQFLHPEFKKNVQFEQDNKIYVPSEEALTFAISRMSNKNNVIAINSFNSKHQFRQLLEPIYPDFFYTKCIIDDLETLSLDFNQSKKYLIKPDRGFFSSCVRVIDNESNLAKLMGELKKELHIKSKLFPNTISKTFVVEEYIENDSAYKLGEGFLENQEIAIDLFYDKQSRPTILNIYHHPYSIRNEYYNTLYYMSYEIFNLVYDMAMNFFEKLGALVKMESLALHAEFKVISNTLIPIEINPCRFAGLGGSDLIYYSFGINPYLAFFNDQTPDWKGLWEK